MIRRILLIKFFCVFASVLYFTNLSSQKAFIESDLPIILIDTYGKDILDNPSIEAFMRISDSESGNINSIGGPYTGYNGKIRIEIRGSTSQIYPKKQYRIETIKNDGSNNNVSLLDMPQENDWILYGPYADKTLIRNVFAYRLYEQMGHYSPRTAFCELVLNGQYQGVYVLIEKIKIDKNRVNIENAENSSESNSSYLVVLDRHSVSDCNGWYTSETQTYLRVIYPDCKEISQNQLNYIKGYLNSFEQILMSEGFCDSIDGYRQYVDLESLADFIILNELAKNIDAYNLSTFFYKDCDSLGGKIKFGPVWDFNIAFGNSHLSNGYQTEDFIAERRIWSSRFMKDSIFCEILSERWNSLRQSVLSNENVLSLIDSLSMKLVNAQERNYNYWDALGRRAWPNFYVGNTYETEIWFLKSWIINRMNWIDLNMPFYKISFGQTDYEVGIFPNPFDYFLTYVFNLEKESQVSLQLIDSNGKFMGYIVENSRYPEGKNMIIWNSFINNSLIPDQLYFLILEVDGTAVEIDRVVKKM
ncbi:MAG: CotH kinase family protein [Bacteroidales bacterium]|nr:CotH kinase family protein [Bacteroidales bacterium]